MSPIRFCILAALLVSGLIFCAGCTQQEKTVKTEPTATLESWDHVRLETTMGSITIALDPAMPVTSGNFETLVKNGFYTNVIFHRVVNGFMIQGGDPTGTGRGGPGYAIKDEFGADNRNDRGNRGNGERRTRYRWITVLHQPCQQ